MLMDVPSLLRSYVATNNRHMQSSSAHVQATWDDELFSPQKCHVKWSFIPC